MTLNGSAFANPIWQRSCPLSGQGGQLQGTRISFGVFSLQAVVTLQGCSVIQDRDEQHTWGDSPEALVLKGLTPSSPTAPGLLHTLHTQAAEAAALWTWWYTQHQQTPVNPQILILQHFEQVQRSKAPTHWPCQLPCLSMHILRPGRRASWHCSQKL